MHGKFTLTLIIFCSLVSYSFAKDVRLEDTGILEYYSSCENSNGPCVKGIEISKDNKVFITFFFDNENSILGELSEKEWLYIIRNQMLIILSTLNSQSKDIYTDNHDIFHIDIDDFDQDDIVIGMKAIINGSEYSGYSMFFSDNETKVMENVSMTNKEPLDYYYYMTSLIEEIRN